MFAHPSPLPVVKATACKLVLLLAMWWQATGASAMALMGCCLESQPCCVAATAASPCAPCAQAAVAGTAAGQPAAAPARAAAFIEVQVKRWVEPVADIWRLPLSSASPNVQFLSTNP